MSDNLSDSEIQAGVLRCLENRRIIARQQADLEAERRSIFGIAPAHSSGLGSSVPFSAKVKSAFNDTERRRLLSMSQEGRDFLAREDQMAKFGPTKPSGVQPAASTKLSRAELDALLALSEHGRSVLRDRRDRQLKAAGIPTGS